MDNIDGRDAPDVLQGRRLTRFSQQLATKRLIAGSESNGTDRVFLIPAKWSRRMPDPNFEGAETHFILVPAAELPPDLPLDANPRDPQLNRPVYRSIAKSLKEDDDTIRGSFHLKHRGITMAAASVVKAHDVKREDGLDVLRITMPNDGTFGIADGGHSYQIVIEAQKAGLVPADQFVKLEVITGLNDTLITDIAGGRNTSLQVQDKSLLDLKNEFAFLKDSLSANGWAERIAWHEGDEGDVDVVDLVAVLSCFDIESFPDRTRHPVDAYRRKKSMLDRFKSDADRYKRLAPIVRDVLYLHDWIAFDSKNRWQQIGGLSGSGGKYGKLDMVEKVQDGRSLFTFTFLPDKTSEYRLRRPALFPILAAFRLLLKKNEATAKAEHRPVEWRKNFDEVLELWTFAGGQLLRTFYEHWDSTGRDLHASGRSPALWGSLYKELAVIDAERRGAI